MSEVAPTSSPPPEQDDSAVYPRLAPLAVGLIMVTFFGAILLLGFRYMTAVETDAFVQVRATPEFAGTRVEIYSEEIAHPAVGTLAPTNKYVLHFPLAGGRYRFRAITENERVLIDQMINVRDATGFMVNLDPHKLLGLPPATRPRP